MKAQKNALLLLLSLLALAPAQAQDDRQPRMTLDAMDFLRWRDQMDKSGEPIEGSPFLNGDFVRGQIYYQDQKTKEGLFRYNILHDEIEYVQNERVMVLTYMPPIDRVVVGADTMIFRAGTGTAIMPPGFFRLGKGGSTRLLVKMEVEFKDKVPPKAMQDPVPARYVRKNDRYFVELASGELRPFNNLKTLISHLDDQQAALTAFAKTEKLAAKAPEDWVRLLRYYDSL